ncbi:MAG: sulfurtransferase TusA family protein [Thermodesulfobacteriota bacterium]|nr:sulfurtransferase TusA family protein [Thermodesulfobacteriota bacterium]
MEGVNIAQTLDLRELDCPLHYVKTKLKLEEMEIGQVLEISLDDREEISNISRSAKEEGHKILEIKQTKNYFIILVERQNSNMGG